MGTLENKYITLTNKNIATTIESIREIANSYKHDSVLLTKTLLSIEEVMLNYQESFGEDTEVFYRVSKRPSKLSIVIELKGTRFNPLVQYAENPNNILLENLNIGAKYTYSNGSNRVGFIISIDGSTSVFYSMGIALAAGIALGLVGQYLPSGMLEILQSLFSRISDTFFGLMKMISTPVVFLCVLQGVIGSGNVDSFKRNGKAIISRYLLDLFFMLAFATAVAIPAYRVSFSSNSVNTDTGDLILDSIFAVFPDNIVGPFYENDNVKTIVLGLLIGVAVIVLKDRMPYTIELVAELKGAFSYLLEGLVKYIPILIGVLVANNIWTGNINAGLLDLWKYALVYIAIMSCILFFNILRLSRTTGFDMKYILKVILKPGIKALITSSTMLAYSDMEDAIVNDFSVNEEDKNFALPLSIAFYQPVMILFGTAVLFFIATGGISVGVGWLISYFVICFMAGVSTPPVNGGCVALLVIIFTALGLPESNLSIAVPLFVLMDYINTGFRVALITSEVTYTLYKNKQ